MYHTNPEINAQIEQAIAAFARENKISKAKTELFTSNVLAMLPKAGKPVSDEALRIRQEIKARIEELKQFEQGFTAKELAEQIKAEPVNIINALKYLAQSEGVILEAGKLEHKTGERGRRKTLWKVA